MGGDEERQTAVRDDVGTLDWENATNLPGETENLPNEDSSTEAMKNENSEDSSIVIVEHNSSGDYDDVRRPAPMPGLEVAHEVERTPIRPKPQLTSRIPVRRQGRAIRFPRTGLPVIHENKGKAPKDIEGNSSASNIVGGRRFRKQTPAGTPTHTYHMATTDETDTHEPMSVVEMDDGIRYTDVCLFTRVLRKPEKVLRQMPEEGSIWVTTGRTKVELDTQFPPPFVNDVREEQHLVRRLQEARFRLTDKGDVEVFCGMQFERIVADAAFTLRQWPLRKLADCVFYMHREPDVTYGMVSRIYRSLRDQRGIFFPSNVDWRTIDLQTYADADLVMVLGGVLTILRVLYVRRDRFRPDGVDLLSSGGV
eukprot:g19064.t1